MRARSRDTRHISLQPESADPGVYGALTSVRRFPAPSSLRRNAAWLLDAGVFAEAPTVAESEPRHSACTTGEVTIHHSHPFSVGEQDRNPLRRFRGRMASPVSIWAATANGTRAGWTLSSFLVADGDPAEAIGLIDEESPLADVLADTATLTINLLGWKQRALADAFAGVAPAPGGPFSHAVWQNSDWGPVLEGSLGWIGARLEPDPDHAGWGLLLRAVVERVEIQSDPSDDVLCYVRGRYRSLPL
jgi:flavin reductase (DIM6/NTAB) family NADH-FMN oxidoreductase RutF